MCYTPITIRNNSKSFIPRYDKVMLQVPCGNCGSCRTKKATDWFVRSYYEYKNTTTRLGGYVLFVTLTYNNKNLPTFSINGRSYLGFWKPDYQHFMARLRIHLRRRFGIDKDGVKVFWVSEYGGITKRPHYHAEIYVNTKKISPSAMRHLITQDWIHGFVYFGQNGGVITNPSAIKYVAKYVTKDLDFYGSINKRDIDDIKHQNYEFYKFLKNTCFPFHCNSQNFGMAITDYVDPDQLAKGTVHIPNSKGNYVSVRVPQYIDRKLYCYRDLETNSYRLTRLGVDVKINRLKAITPRLKADFTSMLDNIDNYMTDSFLADVEYYSSHDYTPDDIRSIIQTFRKKYTVDRYFRYVENDRYMLFYDDVYSFPEPKQINRPAPLRERLSKHFYEWPFGTLGKYGQLASDPALFNDALQHTKDKIWTDLENYAKFFDALRFALGCRKESEYQRKQLNYSKSRKIKEIYGYH